MPNPPGELTGEHRHGQDLPPRDESSTVPPTACLGEPFRADTHDLQDSRALLRRAMPECLEPPRHPLAGG